MPYDVLAYEVLNKKNGALCIIFCINETNKKHQKASKKNFET